jgi:hypothetical protein
MTIPDVPWPVGHSRACLDCGKLFIVSRRTRKCEECAETTATEILDNQATEDDKPRKFKLHDRVSKTRGSSWTGRVCGFYSTSLTPIGYCVESENEPGSVQIYPEGALKLATHDAMPGVG